MNKAAIILVKPQMGENIGAAARVMANFGLVDLRIVAPRDGWPNQKAIDMAANASVLVEQAKVFATLEEAVADLKFLYALTAREREMDKKVVAPREIVIEENAGFVFGAERTGLTNEEISLCDEIISIPVSAEFKSINLAQSVAIICYELSQIADPELVSGSFRRDPEMNSGSAFRELATKEEINSLFGNLENELAVRGFFQEETKKPGMIANIRTMLSRAAFSSQEVRTMRGIIKALTKNSSS